MARSMAKKYSPDERVVYLALKNVFKGNDAEIRQRKTILNHITKHKKHIEVADLFREYDIDTVCNVARTLLTEQVFTSTLKAKLRFPELFDVSPVQSAEREASEAEAAKNEAIAIRHAVQGHEDSGPSVPEPEEPAKSESEETFRDAEPFTSKASQNVPSLFPIYLSFPTQHLLLVKVQSVLERACFEFAQQSIPDVLRENRWDCPESAELSQWTREFLKRQEIFQKKRDVGKPLETLFKSVADIRHAAVHRIRVGARGIEQFMLDAESLATLLQHSTSMALLLKLRRETQLAIEEIERNKYVLRSKLEETMKSIAAQRSELDQLEKDAVSEMLKEDGDYQQFAAMNLLQAIAPEEQAAPSAATTEKGNISDAEDAESAGNDGEFGCTKWSQEV